MEKLPKILIISHTSFTKSDSMGSTLASYFSEYDPDSIAQFYIKDMNPDIPICKRFYRVTDNEVLNKCKHPFRKGNIGEKVELSTNVGEHAATTDKNGKLKISRATGLIIRNFVWNISHFEQKGFNRFVDDFSPDAVLVQPGDFAFLIKLAVKISEKRNIPLIVHQCESYYLKPYFSKSPDYLVYRRQFKRVFEKMMQRASFCIYLCDALEKDYKQHFDTPSATLFKSTAIRPEYHEKKVQKDNFRCIYGGNLGKTVGRAEPLLEMGKAVKKCGGVIDVYTSTTGEHLRELTKENGIDLHGAVSNDELIENTKQSDFVVHIENQSEWHKIDEKYAFSTKIADMLACGRPAIIYGSTEIAGIKYFAENDLGLVIEKPPELFEKISELAGSKEKQEYYVRRALDFARANHDPKKNSEKTKEIILNVCKNNV